MQVEPEALTLLSATAMRDIAHLLRPGHLAQLRRILDDPEASANDRFVALDLLKNANIAAGGVLPMCQDTGTAIVMGKKGQYVLTDGGDEEAISRGIFKTYHDGQPALLADGAAHHVGREEHRHQPPAQIEIVRDRRRHVQVPVHGEGRRLGQQELPVPGDQGAAQPDVLMRWLDEKLRTLGTAACPPYHLALVIGGTSAEFALKTAKLASARYLDRCPQPATSSAAASATSSWSRRCWS